MRSRTHVRRTNAPWDGLKRIVAIAMIAQQLTPPPSGPQPLR